MAQIMRKQGTTCLIIEQHSATFDVLKNQTRNEDSPVIMIGDFIIALDDDELRTIIPQMQNKIESTIKKASYSQAEAREKVKNMKSTDDDYYYWMIKGGLCPECKSSGRHERRCSKWVAYGGWAADD